MVNIHTLHLSIIYIEVKGVLDTIDTLQVIVRDFVCNFLLHFKVCLVFPVSIYENLNVPLFALIYDQLY
jgi:hypothetical protein